MQSLFWVRSETVVEQWRENIPIIRRFWTVLPAKPIRKMTGGSSLTIHDAARFVHDFGDR
jgi:hypothetical protein